MSDSNDQALVDRCVAHDAEALKRLDDEIMKPVQAMLERRFGRDRAEEAIQGTWTRLLLAAPGEKPKLAEYQGRAPLHAWVRTVATRVAIDAIDAARPTDALEDLALACDPELDGQAQRYRPYFEEAFNAAVQTLSKRERVALRMSVVDGLPNEKIAAVFHLHPSSISRLLAQARATLREATFLTLQTRLGLGRQSARSVVGALEGQWHLSLGRLLKQGVGNAINTSRLEPAANTAG
ncbi:MAG: sigma-70 family RNA polymerase sigma factor [Myxococcaceae bacterium]|nr:sigma-70 family RNA polymerase sigma factor [Myxococcaceae bacterium]